MIHRAVICILSLVLTMFPIITTAQEMPVQRIEVVAVNRATWNADESRVLAWSLQGVDVWEVG